MQTPTDVDAEESSFESQFNSLAGSSGVSLAQFRDVYKRQRMRRVLVAAAHVDLVNGVIDVVERAGLVVEGVDLISSALVRALGETGTPTVATDPAAAAAPATEQPEAIVSIGAGLTVVVVHQGCLLYTSRCV